MLQLLSVSQPRVSQIICLCSSNSKGKQTAIGRTCHRKQSDSRGGWFASDEKRSRVFPSLGKRSAGPATTCRRVACHYPARRGYNFPRPNVLHPKVAAAETAVSSRKRRARATTKERWTRNRDGIRQRRRRCRRGRFAEAISFGLIDARARRLRSLSLSYTRCCKTVAASSAEDRLDRPNESGFHSTSRDRLPDGIRAGLVIELTSIIPFCTRSRDEYRARVK